MPAPSLVRLVAMPTSRLLSALLLAATPALALPPPDAAPNATVYKQTVERTVDGKKSTENETTTIRVADKRSRWDRQTAKQTIVFDHPAGAIFTWGGSLPPNVALKSPMPPALAAWDLGYARIAADSMPPVEKGTATIAGQQCTKLQFTSKRYGEPELCVTDKGIVARFHLTDTGSGNVTTFEATSITPGAQPESTFKVPDDLTVEEMQRM
jgi:hypothetical protein